MRSNYRRLGDYIREVDERNVQGLEENLLGVSVEKKFIPSKSNTIGTDFTNYKFVRRNQFVYVPDTGRRGEKIGLAFLDFQDLAMVSQVYTVFEIIDSKKLNPEYLMMWFRRPEFNRFARFHSNGSVREIFDWNDMCDMQLPVPSIEKQRETVKEFNVIQDRIALNQKLIQKLEETAQAIYKQWFVEFEFPDEEGKSYKSNGGEMVWNEELGKEIPKGWEVINVSEFCLEMKSGGTPSRTNPEFWNTDDVPWLKTGEIKNNIIILTEEYISNAGLANSSAKIFPKDTVLMSMYGVNAGEIGILKIESSTNQACCGMICKNEKYSAYLYYHLLHNQKFISSQSIGGAQENLSKEYVEKIPILKPNDSILELKGLKVIIDNKYNLTKESRKISELKNLLLSKLATVQG